MKKKENLAKKKKQEKNFFLRKDMENNGDVQTASCYQCFIYSLCSVRPSHLRDRSNPKV